MATDLAALTTARLLYGRELLMQLKANLFMAAHVSRKYSTQGSSLYGTVRVPNLVVPAVQKRTKNNSVTAGDSSVSYVDVTLTEHAIVPMQLDSLDAVISDIDFRTQMAERAAYRIAEAVETDLASLYYKVGNFYGDPATAAWVDTSKAVGVIGVLDSNKAPQRPRFGALSALSKGSALGNASFTQYNTAGTASTLVSGELGDRFGITWGLCHNVPSHTGGGTAWAGTTLIDNSPGPYAIGTTSIKIDGFTSATPALKKGDAFKLGNYWYSIAADVTGSANAATVTLAQPEGLLATVANNDPVTTGDGVKSATAVNLVFLPEAFALAVAPMGDSRPGLESAIITDDQTGLSIRVSYSYNHLAFAHIFTTELLYGFQCVRPQLACRLLASG